MKKLVKAGEILGSQIQAGEFIWLWFAGDEAPFLPSGWRTWFVESIGPKWVHIREAYGLQQHYRMQRNTWRHRVEERAWKAPIKPSRSLIEASFAASDRYSAYPTRADIRELMLAATFEAGILKTPAA